MEALDPKPGNTDQPRAESFDDWWASLAGEDRFLVMDCVRLEETPGLAEIESRHPAPAPLVTTGLPSAALAGFVRRRAEYLQRFAIADSSARLDDMPIGPSNVPEAHERTTPIMDE